MNLKAIALPVAAALATGAALTPVILSQRETIASLEQRLAAASPPVSPQPVSAKFTAAEQVAAAVAAKRDDARRSEYEQTRARLEPAQDRIKAWTDSIMQIDDADRKLAALDELLAALSSDNAEDVFAAITAYSRVGNVEFDRAPFRPAIVSLLGHDDAMLRRSALGAINGLPPDDGDIALVSGLANDPDFGVRKGVVASLFWLTKGDLTGDAGETVLGILHSAEVPSRSLINAMWGARFSPELEQKLVEFARAPTQPGDEELPYYAVYSCLSTQQNKGPACVDLLIERLADPDSHNVGGRAAWGLAYGVQPGLGLESRIADAAIDVWRNRTDGYLRKELLKCIAQYGSEPHAAALDEIAAAPAIGADQKQSLESLAATIRQRTAAAADGN